MRHRLLNRGLLNILRRHGLGLCSLLDGRGGVTHLCAGHSRIIQDGQFPSLAFKFPFHEKDELLLAVFLDVGRVRFARFRVVTGLSLEDVKSVPLIRRHLVGLRRWELKFAPGLFLRHTNKVFW